MTPEEVIRLSQIAANLTAHAGELVAMLEMPTDEHARGDLSLLDLRHWADVTDRESSRVALDLVLIQTILETIEKRRKTIESGADLPEHSSPLRSALARRLAGLG